MVISCDDPSNLVALGQYWLEWYHSTVMQPSKDMFRKLLMSWFDHCNLVSLEWNHRIVMQYSNADISLVMSWIDLVALE